MKPYQYTPLQSPRHIRLVQLQADIDEDPVVCRLTQVCLDDNPTYCALSYTWDMSDTPHSIDELRKITCDGQELLVTPNLYAALNRFRLSSGPDERRNIWIDAICINQKDNEERSQQVRIMHTIYKQADHVLVWLGEDDGSHTKATGLLKRMYESQGSERNDFLKDVMDPESGFLPDCEEEWSSIGSFLGSRWFTRIWVIQEVVMASKISIIYGDQEIDWDVVEAIVILLQQNGAIDLQQLRQSRPGITMILTTSTIKNSLAEGHAMTVMEVLALTRMYGATDTRDKFYSFLGIMGHRTDRIFIPNYEMPNHELYWRIAMYSLEKELLYTALSLAQPSPESMSQNIPSWVPDWGRISLYYTSLLGNPKFRTLDTTPRYVKFFDEGTTLHVRGMKFDRIKAVGSKLSVDSITKDNIPEQTSHMIQMQANFIDEGEQIATEGFLPHGYPIEGFARTLLCDSFENTPSLIDNSTKILASFESYKEYLERFKDVAAHEYEHSWLEEHIYSIGNFEFCFSRYSAGRRFGMTHHPRMAMFTTNAKVGDIICAIAGAKTPFVIRERGDDTYQFVGECYVDGVMYGELYSLFAVDDMLEEIRLR